MRILGVILGGAVQIFDNMIGRGLIEPMIVVMPNGNVSMSAAPGESTLGFVSPRMDLPQTMDGGFEEHFLDVVGFVDGHYRTVADKSHRAIAGLSMGGFHSMHISTEYPDMFDYVGLFSAAVIPGRGESRVYEDFDVKLARQFYDAPSVYWIGIGRDDFLYGVNSDFRGLLDSRGYGYEYYKSSGGHVWRNWRVYLREFLPKLFREK